MMKVAVICAFFAVCVLQTEAACSRGMIRKEKYEWSPMMFFYCEYKGMKLGPGSSFTDYNTCQECTCSHTGLSCCGFGAAAGVFQVPGCKVVADHCELAFLNEEGTGPCKKE